MLKKIFLAAVLAVLASSTAFADGISINSDLYYIDENEYEFQKKPFMVGETVYVNAREVLLKLGYSIKLESTVDGISVYKNDVQSVLLHDKFEHILGYKMYKYDKSLRFTDGMEYVSTELLEDLTGEAVRVSGEIPHQEYYIGDTYRIKEETIENCGNCYALNGSYLFSPVTVHDKNALSYADIVNKIAEKIPGAKVYSMLITDSSEIYAPKRFYTGQARAIEMVYNNLSENVTQVRVHDKLLEKADEKIYFNTDHHWTHRGAFYAWQTFLQVKGLKALDIESFEKSDTDAFSGSYFQRMPSEKKLQNLISAETMERFLPVYDTTTTIYSDGEMSKMIGRVPLINIKNNTYSCFISGDHPLSVIESSIGNGKKLAIIKESFGNALATWAVNNYEYVYVIDIRGFKGGQLHISDFYEKTNFDDLIIESYPTTIESKELRGYLLEMAE